RATVKGNLVVALVQGVLGGAAMALLGVSGALLLGAIMSFAALLPSVGAALVWAPVALYLLATGAVWKGVVLIVFGTLVIGLIDNILRPLLVGKDTKLPDWLVLITTIGGMALFGISGFVIGPVVAAMFVAVWGLVGKRAQRDDARPEAGPPGAHLP
ncbi:MAG: AI-2E family transporter, partial [Chitinophagaceae bacterium]|nr:AI-2E family transporter [Rubrivivax sp.]